MFPFQTTILVSYRIIQIDICNREIQSASVVQDESINEVKMSKRSLLIISDDGLKSEACLEYNSHAR